MKISGDVRMIHQKCQPCTGISDQRTEIEWFKVARTPMPAASAAQNASPIPMRPRREQMITPPTKITAYAATIGAPRGPHQKSSGSTRPLPSTMNPRTRATLDGLKTCPVRNRTPYFVNRPRAATPAKMYHPRRVQ